MSLRVSEAILRALKVAIEAQAPAGATVRRNDPLEHTIPAAGSVVLRDGDPGDPETLLSPITYLYEHVAEIEIQAQGDDRDDVFDALAQSISAAVVADRSLGGLCDWVEAKAPAPLDLHEYGAAPIKAATIAVILHYATSSPVG